VVSNASALGSTVQGTTVNTNAVLILKGISVGAEPLSLVAATLSADTASNSWTGNIQLTNTSLVTVATNITLNLGGIIGGSGGLTKNGPGALLLSGGSSNSFSGATTVNQGALLLSKTASNAVPGALVIGDGAGGGGSDLVQFSANQQIAGSSAVTINNSGLLDLNGFSGAIG